MLAQELCAFLAVITIDKLLTFVGHGGFFHSKVRDSTKSYETWQMGAATILRGLQLSWRHPDYIEDTLLTQRFFRQI